MKKLRSNFTTTEQSKRLLELGVPADSADMYYHTDIGFTRFYSEPEVIPSCELFSTGNSVYIYDIPCWSVGRLIEIYEICTQTKFKRVQQTDNLVYLSPLEDVLMQIEHNACGFYDNTKWDANLLKWIKNLLEE
jgi:hypothetical protein